METLISKLPNGVIPVLCLILMFLSIDGIAQKSMEALRIAEDIAIDGVLDESIWNKSEVASDFTNWQPNAGTKSTYITEVKVLYDDEAMYIGAIMHVDNVDSISRELTQRDDIGNTDWFGIVMDTYGNGTDGLEFIISVTGVQFDAKMTESQGEDTNWDGVWFSSVKINEDNWTAEVKIPYSALRFSNKQDQSWRVNFMRSVQGLGEKSSWNTFDPSQNGFLTQAGTITGLKNITPPVRLSFSPYLSLYAQSYSAGGDSDVSSSGYSYNGGMDLKYGINDAFTLDMTLIPDFGQVRSDDVILNLSPFEVRYDENRQFFTEGLELFAQNDLFYSRRVGGAPVGHNAAYRNLSSTERVVDNPSNARLYNATKITGRNSGGLGIGVFNAVSRETTATIQDEETGSQRAAITSPLTNYNIVVLDQNLPNNSSLTFMNTNVWRDGNLYHDANVTSLKFDVKNKAQSYSVSGRGVYSQLINPESDNVNGHNFNIGASKISGNFNLYTSYEEVSEDFNSNDLGFVRRNNYRDLSLGTSYSIYKDFGPFNRANYWANFNYQRQIVPDAFASIHYNGGFWMQLKSLWSVNMWANYEPEGNDYYEPRTFGRFYKEPSWFNVGYWMSTDRRKPFQIQGYIDFRSVNEEGRNDLGFEIEPRYRFSNQFSMGLELSTYYERNDKGFVNNADQDIIFGNRDRTTYSNEINAYYTINDKMGLDFRLRHYWSKVSYDQFYMLEEDGRLADSDYDQFHDFAFNAFNIDLNYRWRFAPGSDIIINWKNNISGVHQELETMYSNIGYSHGLKDLDRLPQTNSLSLRIVYYLDYNNLKKMF